MKSLKKKISSVDVAKEAGVSRATVSYVLNNVYDVKLKDETREKVLNAARKLGYFPNFTAQALKTNKCMSIGIVSRRKVDEFRFVNILGGIQPVLSRHGYSIVLCSSERDEEGFPEYYKLYKSKKIDGVIFISYQEQVKLENIDEHVKLVTEENIPLIREILMKLLNLSYCENNIVL